MNAEADPTSQLGESYLKIAFRRMRRDRACLGRAGDHPRPRVLAFLAPVLTSYDPIKQNLDEMLSAPSFKHPLGTDRYGRDVLTRIIYGCRYALIIGVGVVAIQLVVGVSLGLTAGYFGGLRNP